MEKPVGKKVTSVSPMEGALTFLGGMLGELNPDGGTPDRRADALTDEIGDITIDTCLCSDTGVWETAIKREGIEGKWVIVSQYDCDEEAEVSHKQWVAYLKENPTCELEDIDNWNLRE